jgi:hypothetical protein
MKRNNKSLISGYDYSTPEMRTVTIPQLFDKAKNARTVRESEWEKYNDYYNFIHDVSDEVREFSEEHDLPWTPAVCPDPWIMVESQIDPIVPVPEFRGRDDDQDSEKAKQRELAVKYICENNNLDHMNTANERRLLKLGDAFWKAYWDIEMRCGVNEGDIRIADVSPEAIFPDPSVRSGDIQDGQYLAYVYTMHKVKFYQLYGERLRKLGKDADEVEGASYVPINSVFDLSTAIDDTTDTVQVLEFWFRWPTDGETETTDGKKVKVRAGTVGCSIQCGDIELKLIPEYWKRTQRQCQLFPFVHYWRIRDENSIWNKSELYPILDLVDAEDRKLSSALLNDAFMANDIILCEEGAMADGYEPTNAPGAVWMLKQNRAGGVARLGGLQSAGNATILLNYLKERIEAANRNWDSAQGKETARQTTATGLAMLREDSNAQADIKKADRRAGFERLYQLLDWLALEYFDDDRLLYLGADKDKGRPEAMSVFFNAGNYAMMQPPVYDAITNQIVRDEWEYFPMVDVTVTAGDGAQRGKIATLQALSTLTQANITADNWQLYAAQLDILDIPDKDKIIEGWRRKFEPQAQPATGGMGMVPGMVPGMTPAMGMAPGAVPAIEPSAPMSAPLPEMAQPGVML